MGGWTDAQVLDQQAGMEFALFNLWAALCGINLAHDVGYLGSGMIGDLRAIVFNNDIIGHVRHVTCRGIPFNRDTQAIDVIERVGPGGHFMDDQHTFDHFREEFWRSDLLNTKTHDQWKADGEKTVKDKAAEEVKKILGSHTPEPLSNDVTTVLEKIMNE